MAGHLSRVAVIDCGTNSIRLLVADLVAANPGVRVVDVHREMRVVRLGEGVDRTGRLSTAAVDRTWSALSDYAAIVRTLGAVKVRMVATSATRDASNRQEFADMVTSTLGQPPEVISGAEEAELSLRGAVAELDEATGPFLVVDIGGGSTELAVGSVAGTAVRILGELSLDIGCVRMTERVLRTDPPTRDEIDRARIWAHAELAGALDRLPLGRVRRWVAVSGTATTVAAAALRLTSYDPGKIHLARISAASIGRIAREFLAQNHAHRASLPYMHPGRVDVIGSGALVLSVLADLIVERRKIDEVTISEHDILDGLALSLA